MINNRMIPNHHPNDTNRMMSQPNPNGTNIMIPLPNPNDAYRMFPQPHPNDAYRMFPQPNPNDAYRMFPQPHPNDAYRMFPQPHPNDAYRMVPHPYQNGTNRMILQSNPNDMNIMIPYSHPNGTNRIIPYPHSSDANRMIPQPHPNDANRMIPEPHPNDANRMIPYPNSNDANIPFQHPHLNDANRMFQQPHQNDANRMIQQPHQNDANRMIPCLHAEHSCMSRPTLQSRNSVVNQIRPTPNGFIGQNLHYQRQVTTQTGNGNPVRMNHDNLFPNGRMCNGDRQMGTEMPLFFPRPYPPLFVDEQTLAYHHSVPNDHWCVPGPFVPQGRSRDDIHCHRTLTGHYVGDSSRRGMSTVILDNRDMVLRTSFRLNSSNQHVLPVNWINTPLALQGPFNQLQSNNTSQLFQHIYKSILSTMTVHSLDVHNAAAVVIAREYQVRLTTILSRGSSGASGELQTIVQSMMSMDLMFNLHISREALRPMSIIWNHDKRRQMNTKELFEVFWVTGLPAAERPKLGVAVCVIYGDPVAKLFASDHTIHTHAESTMIDYLSRVLISERVVNMHGPSKTTYVEVFQNYSPCGDCSKKYCHLFNEFARFGLRVKITIHFVSLYKLYWDIGNPQGNLPWLPVEVHCYNRDWLLKLMDGVLDIYTFNEITWIRLLGALGMEVGRGIISKYIGCGRLKADTWAAQMLERLKEFGATRYPQMDLVAFLNQFAIE